MYIYCWSTYLNLMSCYSYVYILLDTLSEFYDDTVLVCSTYLTCFSICTYYHCVLAKLIYLVVL